MGNGYWQKCLRVDLSSGRIYTENIEEADLKNFIGGAALGAEYLRREVGGKIDPLSAENRLIVATGPFQSTSFPGGAKFSMVSISPLTGTFADSAAGAGFGLGVKCAGYDVIIIQGRAKKPVYLHIVDDDVEIRDASEFWGLESFETIDNVRKQCDDPALSVASIGPAGENLIAIACIVVDKHSFVGRCGLGCIMGSKNLKAIAVRGTKTVPLHNPQQVDALTRKHLKEIATTVKENGFRDHGTPSICESVEALGDMPIKYWEGDTWPEGAKKLGAPNSTEELQAKPYPCKHCPVGCHRKIEVTEPAEYAVKGVGPEYETLGMMGTNLLIDDPKIVAKGNDLANRMGVDTISMGAMVGFCMECWEKGWITAKDTDGVAYTWGNPDALFSLIEQVSQKRDFGARFAKGTLAAAQAMGPEVADIVVHAKGLDFPAHDARACNSLAPTYATSPRGACHFRGGCEDIEMGGFFIPELGINEGYTRFFERENQGLLASTSMDFFGLLNSLVLCDFMVDGGDMSFSNVRDVFNAITGWNYDITDLMLAAERGTTVMRMINIRDGYDGSTDKLPKKMFSSAKEGFRAGKVIPFKELLRDFYEARGWGTDGIPSQETLKRLGL